MRLSAGIALAALAALGGCAEGRAPLPHTLTAAEERGRLLLRQYGCAACHSIPGVAAAQGNVGPPLAASPRRVYLAGVLREHTGQHGALDPRAGRSRSAHRHAGHAGARAARARHGRLPLPAEVTCAYA